ncbi:MAG: DDE-type integrase/transposase/recombinase [Thermoleophilaceae bacterium]|nr:DDE-type integrase/transposase/recombinase [Thermoleophilaceae bacterium]
MVCDLKYIQTGQGFLFLAAVQDVYSRRIIGWSMRDDLKAELVLDALGMAVSARGSDSAGVVAHSDHGAQYTSLVYGSYELVPASARAPAPRGARATPAPPRVGLRSQRRRSDRSAPTRFRMSCHQHP